MSIQSRTFVARDMLAIQIKLITITEDLVDVEWALLAVRNKLLKTQRGLDVHYQRTSSTILTANDAKFDGLQNQVNVINAAIVTL